jgi:Large polyvalent protein-associated domain 7
VETEDPRARGDGQSRGDVPGDEPTQRPEGAVSDNARPRVGRTAERAPARPKRAAREPAENAIQASRKPRQARSQPGEATAQPETAEAPASSATASSALQRADSDPWTVPQSVRDRFVQDGHRFYFPDGAPAFKDLGRRLTTVSENTQVVHSLIEIAHSRGWTEVTVTGTERFRQEAWRQARLAGLGVRGYRPTDEQQAQLVRGLGRSLARPTDRTDSISTDPAAPAPARPEPPKGATDASERAGERIGGKLLDHGPDNYLHDPNAEGSYFVRLGIPGGYREVWGKDIERAMTKSLTQPQIGDEVMLQRTGRDPVTVKRPETDARGQIRPREVGVFRNRWVLEKREFFEQRAAAAHVVRDESVGPQAAVRQHPGLAGTYLNLRAAELASQRLRDPEDQRRFVSQVRTALADAIERGEPLQPVRLRERRTRDLNGNRQPLTRE